MGKIGNCSVVVGILVSIFLLFGFGTISNTAEAKVYLRGDCKHGYSVYKKKRPWKAFALSRNGYSCGLGWNGGTRKKTVARAMAECRKRGKGCRIYAVSGKSRKAKKSSKRRRSRKPRLSNTCRKIFEKWKPRPRYKAFLISRNGSVCHSNWNHRALDAAIAAARDSCIDPNCRIYSIGAPSNVIQKWQENLEVLGLYSGSIDAEWGPATKAAIRKFARRAKIKNPISGSAFLQLHWAALIKTKYQVTSKKAIENSGAAVKAKSLEDVRKLVLP